MAGHRLIHWYRWTIYGFKKELYCLRCYAAWNEDWLLPLVPHPDWRCAQWFEGTFIGDRSPPIVRQLAEQLLLFVFGVLLWPWQKRLRHWLRKSKT